MKKLQAKLNRLAENLESPIAVILEGRDTAGKSSTIRELTHYLPPVSIAFAFLTSLANKQWRHGSPTGKPNCREKIRSCFLIGHGIAARWFSILSLIHI